MRAHRTPGHVPAVSPAEQWGAVLRRHMERRGLRPVDVARTCGVPQPTVANWLHGRSLPQPAMAHHVAEELDLPSLATLCDRLRGGTCGDCGRSFIDAGRHMRKLYCSWRCYNRQRWRRLTAARPERAAVTSKRLSLYMSTTHLACTVWCSPDGLCPDATCPIQAAGLSPLPLARDARRVA